MKRLFLNSIKIENIEHLREVFNESANKEVLFKELWNKFLSGNLSQWLQQLLEMQDIDKSDNDYCQAILSFQNNDQTDIQTYGDLLCRFCKIEVTYNMKKIMNSKFQVSEKEQLKLEQLQMTEWYNDSLLNGCTDWDKVIMSQQELDDAIANIGELYFEKAKNSNGVSDSQFILYICNMGHPYTIDFKFSNIRFIGLGLPKMRIQLSKRLRIVLEDYDISFEKLILESINECQLVINREKCKNVILANGVSEI